MDQRHADLHHHRIPCRPQETLDFQVLFDPLEEQLDLPPPPVDPANGVRGKPKVVCEEFIPSARLLVNIGHLAQGRRVFQQRREVREHDLLVRDDPRGAWGVRMLSESRGFGVAPEACHEIRALQTDLIEPPQIAIPLVIHVNAVRPDREQRLGRMYVGHLSVAHHHVAGEIAREVQLGVQFDRPLCPSVSGP